MIKYLIYVFTVSFFFINLAIGSETEYVCTKFDGGRVYDKIDKEGFAVFEDGDRIVDEQEVQDKPHKIIFKIKRNGKSVSAFHYIDLFNSERVFVDGDTSFGSNVNIREDDYKITMEQDSVFYSNYEDLIQRDKGFLKEKTIIFFKKTKQLYYKFSRYHQSRHGGNSAGASNTFTKYYDCKKL